MNCQQFTSFIVEAARGRMMDAASRDAAMRHTEECAACAARLAQEQSLTHALRALALDMKDLSAPASTEAKLLAAFQEKLASTNAVAATTTNDAKTPATFQASVAPATALPLRTRRFARVAMAIAASLVVAALVALYTQFTRTAPSPQDLAANNQPERVQQSQPVDTTTISPPLASSKGTSAPLPEVDRPQALQRDEPRRSSGKLARRAATPKMITSSQVIDGGNAIIEAVEGEAARGGAGATARPNEPESMTDFISLVADATPATPLESGQLVRVQVPRAALASLGLPLNAERGNEPVKADVLVGYDGLARAIRFVR